MNSIEELKNRFDLLPVDSNNMKLYQKLLHLDISVYKPLMDEILSGRMDIEDTRPIFSSFFSDSKKSFYTSILQKRTLINNADDLKNNLITRLASPEKNIREITLLSSDYNNIKAEVITKYSIQYQGV